MQAAKSLFDQGRFEECIGQCESGLKFATNVADKFQWNILASRAAVKSKDASKAISFAAMATELDDTKMLSWQTLSEAYELANDPRLGDSLSRQLQIAQRNQALDRALVFAKEAARAYSQVGNHLQATLRWTDAEKLAPPDTVDIECLSGLIESLEKSGNVAQADQVLWRLCENNRNGSDRSAAIRYLSRPAYVILEARRRQTGSQEELLGAWEEFNRRCSRLEGLHDDSLDDLLLACKLIDQETFSETQNEQESLVLALKYLGGSQKDMNEAVRARLLFFLARHALELGDPRAALFALSAAEQLEQVVYTKVNAASKTDLEAAATSGPKQVMIGSAPVQSKPFHGQEMLSLICGRTTTTHLTTARCYLALAPEGVKDAIKKADKHIRDAQNSVNKNEIMDHVSKQQIEDLLFIAYWMNDAVDCSKGCGSNSVKSSKEGGESSSNLVKLLKKVQGLCVSDDVISELTSIASSKNATINNFLERRIASLAVLMAHTILVDMKDAPPQNESELASIEIPPTVESSNIRQAIGLIQNEEQDSDGFIQLQVLWRSRIQFVLSRLLPDKVKFDPNSLTAILAKHPDQFPMAYEMLGKYLIGLERQSFLATPYEQPTTGVKNGANAVKALKKAVELDPIGLGAIAPLANAYHAGKKEADAAQLYQSVVDYIGSMTRLHPLIPHVSSFIWTRLAQQQFHYNKFSNASTSFQRALSSHGRPDQSVNIDAWTGLGECHVRMGRLGAAAQAFEKACLILQNDRTSDDFDSMLCACSLKLAGVRNQMAQPLLAAESLESALNLKSGEHLKELVALDLAQTKLEIGRFWNIRGARTSAVKSFDEAKVGFQLLLAKDRPLSPATLWKGLADVHSETGNGDEAVTCYLKVIQLEPWQNLARCDLARQLIVKARLGSALITTQTTRRVCEGAVHLNPLDQTGWTLLGLATDKMDVLIRQHALVRSLQLNPGFSPLPWLDLAWVFAEHDKLTLARRAFSQAQAIDPESSAAWLGHALLAQKEGKSDLAALECAVDAALYAPDTMTAQAMMRLAKRLALALQVKIDPQYVELAKRLLDATSRVLQMDILGPKQKAEAHDLMGIALLALGCPSQAAKEFERSAELFLKLNEIENADRVLLNLAQTCGDPAVGVQIATMALNRSPSLAEQSSVSWMIKGNLNLSIGKIDEASACFEKAVSVASSAKNEDPIQKNRVLGEARIKWAETLFLQNQDFFGLEVAKEATEDASILSIDEAVDVYFRVSALAPRMREFVKSNPTSFPSLEVAVKNASQQTLSKLANLACTDEKAGLLNAVRMYPWEVDNWKALTAETTTTKDNGIKSAIASVLLWFFGQQFPTNVCSILKVVDSYLWDPTQKLNSGHGRGYWATSTMLKAKHLCPWEQINVTAA